ncbi:MAG: rubrerythrin [Thermoguttaceae bacterium]
MAKIKGTETEKNLLKAFAGESQARNRYTFFASQAKKDGYEQIADAFLETAEQEKEHAKRFFKFLEGGMVEITASFPAGVIGTTLENLKAAADGEYEEWDAIYPKFAEIAKTEGFADVAAAFKAISVAEKQHEKRYRGFLKNLEDGTVFDKKAEVTWRCRNCGYITKALSAPPACAACLHPRAWFEILAENW